MADPPLLTLSDIHLRIGDRVLFEGAALQLTRGERACLVGRNGAGKTTLMRVIAGLLEPDSGDVFVQPGIEIAYLPQDPVFEPDQSARDYVLQANVAPHEAEAALSRVAVEPDRRLDSLSGGEGRRVALARAFAVAPDILLLDEPTNHLDLDTIQGLERVVRDHRGAILVVSHDRAFLKAISTSTLWLERRKLRRLGSGYGAFDAWQERVLGEEARAAEKIDQKLAAEARWLHRGVTARRRRNQGRLRRLEELRAQRATVLGRETRAKLEAEDGQLKSRLVIDAVELTKRFGERTIVDGFSTRVLRGDRIGILGPNGAGKTTLLRLLTGDLAADGGRLRLAKNLSVAYFDQHRAALDRRASLWETLCPEGGDTVWVHGRPRHVVAYLKDFLFDPDQAHSPVSSLSGGERNRLLLAKILARPSELLVLDEPTNDLDMDTLDRLEDMLADYPGTLLVVSHDRDFLDQVVSSTIAFEADGHAVEYAGGYSDYVAQRRKPTTARSAEPAARTDDRGSAGAERRPRQPTKLGYREQRELDGLPDRMAALEREIAALEETLGDPDLYRRDTEAFNRAAARLESAKTELDHAETRWLELEALRERLRDAG